MIVVPGGGYLIRATREQEAVAIQFTARGYHAFVLRYDPYLRDREGMTEGQPHVNPRAHYSAQQLQLMEAMHVVRAHADQWGVDADAVFVCGFSAGGHIAGSLGMRWSDPNLIARLPFDPLGEELRPTGCVLGYPMVRADLRSFFARMRDVPGNIAWQSDMIMDALFGTTAPSPEQAAEPDLVNYVGAHDAPMFIWHCADAPVVDPRDTTALVAALQAADVPCEYHLFAHGGHGLACANKYYAKSEADVNEHVAAWLPLATAWMDDLSGR